MGFIAFTQFGLSSVLPRLSGAADAGSRQPRTSDQILFSSKLTARLDNLKRNRYAPSDKSIDSEISQRDAAVTSTLANRDPKALQSYSSFLSGIAYDKSARIVSNVEHTVRSLSSIPSQEEAQALTDSIVAAFGERSGKT